MVLGLGECQQANSVIVTTAFWNTVWQKKDTLFDQQTCAALRISVSNKLLQKLALYSSTVG